MAENNLTDFEAQELLRQYSSDLRKLEYLLIQLRCGKYIKRDKRKQTSEKTAQVNWQIK